MKENSLIIPALRGNMGTWIYYICLMPMSEIAQRVSYANEIHSSKALSHLIQRSLEGTRARHIADYLANNDERFFSSLVLATYGGNPDWLEIGNFKSNNQTLPVSLLPSSATNALGFLRLTGKEKIFAIDGQHRLAGIKQALQQYHCIANEQLPVILVGHKKTASGLQRTRRLFTTLNKTAKPVQKRDIIALDEDDAMAIVTRRLVETHPWFQDPKIAIISSPNIPPSNRTCLMTISNLYDILKLLFNHEVQQHFKKRADQKLRLNRPSDDRLNHLTRLAENFFLSLGQAFPPIGEFFSAADPKMITTLHRGPHGGHLLFRPIGLMAFTSAAIKLATRCEIPLTDAVLRLKSIPTDLASPPYRMILWDTNRSSIVRGTTLANKLIQYMARVLPPSELDSLIADYAAALGEDPKKIELPPQIE